MGVRIHDVQQSKDGKQREMKDVTIPVYKILSCVRQMDQAFNKEMVSATLRGVKEQTLLRLGLHRLAAYGSWVRYGQNQIDHLIQLLVDNGALYEHTGRYKVMKFGPTASNLLKNKEPVFTNLPNKTKK